MFCSALIRVGSPKNVLIAVEIKSIMDLLTMLWLLDDQDDELLLALYLNSCKVSRAPSAKILAKDLKFPRQCPWQRIWSDGEDNAFLSTKTDIKNLVIDVPEEVANLIAQTQDGERVLGVTANCFSKL